MAENFTATQRIGLPNYIYITDTSTGLVGVLSRKIYVQDVQGAYLPSGTFIAWALVDPSLSFYALAKDTAPFVKTEWIGAGGAILYTKTILCNFRLTNLQQSFRLTASLTSDPSLLGANDWWMNKMKLRVNIDDSVEAVEIGANQGIAQNSLERATFMTTYKNDFF